MAYKKFKVTFAPKTKGYEDKIFSETFDTKPHANGFVQCYQTRAMALNLRIIEVKEI